MVMGDLRIWGVINYQDLEVTFYNERLVFWTCVYGLSKDISCRARKKKKKGLAVE